MIEILSGLPLLCQFDDLQATSCSQVPHRWLGVWCTWAEDPLLFLWRSVLGAAGTNRAGRPLEQPFERYGFQLDVTTARLLHVCDFLEPLN